MWLLKVRKKFWEEVNPGKRYALLRQSKNSLDEHKGKFTQGLVSARTGLSPNAISNFEAGVASDPEKVIRVLITDLGLSSEQFYSNIQPRKAMKAAAKVKTNPVPTPVISPNPISGIAEPPMYPAKPKVKGPSKDDIIKSFPPIPKETPKEQKPSATSKYVIVNHMMDAPVFIVIKDGEIHIYNDMEKKVPKDATWVFPADRLANGDSHPRKTVYGTKPV